MRNVIVAALAGTLAGVAVQSAPRPVPAPAGAVDYKPTLMDLNRRVQALEVDNWTLTHFYACVRTRHIVLQGDVAFLTWKLSPACVKRITG